MNLTKIRFGHLKESAKNEFKNKLDLDDPKPDTVIATIPLKEKEEGSD